MIIASAIQAGGNIAGGILGNRNQETKMQKTTRHLVDDLLGSLNGGGKYGDIFASDEAAFDKSFRQPAMSNFKNMIAPQIQQESIFSGQQRGTGLDDQLLRAGVDMDSLINQHLLNYMEKGKDRKMNVFSGIMGMGAGAPAPMSAGGAAMQGLGSYLQSDNFSNNVNDIFQPKTQTQQPQRQGFVPSSDGGSSMTNMIGKQ